jgi:hypothetical protein
VEVSVGCRRHKPVLRRTRDDEGLEVRRVWLRGLQNTEIAFAIGVSSNTVRNTLVHIFEKVGRLPPAARRVRPMSMRSGCDCLGRDRPDPSAIDPCFSGGCQCQCLQLGE